MRPRILLLSAWAVVVFVVPSQLRAQASIVPVSRILRAQASVPPNVHTPPNVVADPDPGGPLSHSASATAGGQTSTASITTNILPDQMRFSVLFSAQGGAAQSSANAGSTAQINLTSNAEFLFQSQWDIQALGSITVRDAANALVFSHSLPGPGQAMLDLPAGTYTIIFGASLPGPGGVLGGYTFTQVPEPAAGLPLLATVLVATRRRQPRRRR